jgi:hypothetical protein
VSIKKEKNNIESIYSLLYQRRAREDLMRLNLQKRSELKIVSRIIPLSPPLEKGEINSILQNNITFTYCAMAGEAVIPGDSMPTRFMNLGESSLMTKSQKSSSGPCSFGRMPDISG